MAPTRKKADRAPKTTKHGKDRVVKRPARGFHRSRNGVLNVAPKGGEKELVKKNQNSPLLQLPAEIRRQIWEHVLGYKLVAMHVHQDSGLYVPRVIAPYTERGHGTQLLRTCRQIYSETALLPLKLNVFSFAGFGYDQIEDVMKSMRPYQRTGITQLQLRIHPFYGLGVAMLMPIEWYKSASEFNLDFLPSLKTVSVVVANPNDHPKAEDTKKAVENQLDAFLAGRNVKIVFEDTHLEWNNYLAGWNYSAQ